MGRTRFLLGMAIKRDKTAGTVLLEQEAFANAVLDTFGTADARPTTSPSEAGPMTILDDEVLSTEGTTYLCHRFRRRHIHGLHFTTGVVLNLAGGPVDWTSSKQTVVANSWLQAEFVALPKGCNIIKYFRHLLNTINRRRKRPQCGRTTRAL